LTTTITITTTIEAFLIAASHGSVEGSSVWVVRIAALRVCCGGSGLRVGISWQTSVGIVRRSDGLGKVLLRLLLVVCWTGGRRWGTCSVDRLRRKLLARIDAVAGWGADGVHRGSKLRGRWRRHYRRKHSTKGVDAGTSLERQRITAL
jgi:hypothetical protein